MLERIPRFEYDNPTIVFQPDIPQRVWTVVEEEVGSSEISATGIGASYVVRNDYLLEIVVRYVEELDPAMKSMIRYGKQWPNTLTFYPDSLDLGTFYEVMLWSPRMGQMEARATRTENFEQALEMTLVLRKTDGIPWDITYHDE